MAIIEIENTDDSDDDADAVAAALAKDDIESSFPATSYGIDPCNFNSNDIPITNVVLPLSKLLSLIQSSFCCKVCRSYKNKQITIERYGIATSIYYECLKCGKNNTICCANLREDLELKWSEKPQSKRFKDTKKDSVNAMDFELNPKLYLAAQQCGGGVQEAKVVAGILGLHTNALHGRWGGYSGINWP